MNTDEIAATVEAARKRREEQGREIEQALRSSESLTYPGFLRQRTRNVRSKVALIHGGRRVTYGELFDRIDAARSILYTHGLRANQTVALLLDNSDHYVVWYLAALDFGAIAVPLNTKLVPREINYILAHSRSNLLVSEERFVDLFPSLHRDGEDINIISINKESGSSESKFITNPSAPISLEEACALYYTSGTTGVPKGVVHTHRSQIASTLQCPIAWEYDRSDLIALCVTPLFHIAAHTIFLPVLAHGGTLIVEPYRTETALRFLAEFKVNSFFAVPSMLLMLVDKAGEAGVHFPAMKSLQFGAAPIPVHALERVQKLFPNAALVHGMGQTESSGSLVTLPSSLAFSKAGSVGFALPGTTIAIFDENDRPLPPGEVGQLVAKGPNVMSGYFDAPEATELALRNDWLHSGDLGYMDEHGCVFLVDRSKDMIIRGGENIYSTEVEHVLIAHPDISAAAVIGLPDRLFGERVHAILTLKDGKETLDEPALIEFCRSMLASYKVPASFEVVAEMPMTATGKIQKGKLRETRQ